MKPGIVFWITGLSGAGKTTVSRSLCDRMREAGHSVLLLDGDELRAVFGDDLGYSADDRKRCAMRYSRLCAAIAAQGVNVICSTISMWHQCHAWNRENIPRYMEVYLRVPIEELIRRDSKGIYSRAKKGELSSVFGVDLEYEEPQSPHILIDHSDTLTAEDAVESIWQEFNASAY